jgi:hypothetical protein
VHFSGLKNVLMKQSVMDDAARAATGRGGNTLETMIESKDIQVPECDINNPASIKAWEDVSAAYANQVSGEVKAVIGSQLRDGNIWGNILGTKCSHRST